MYEYQKLALAKKTTKKVANSLSKVSNVYREVIANNTKLDNEVMIYLLEANQELISILNELSDVI